MASVLRKLAKVYEVSELLTEILSSESVRTFLLHQIFEKEGIQNLFLFDDKSPAEISKMLIEGVPLPNNNLTNFLSKERFLLRPLHNLFFTRDPAIGMNNKMLISKMASSVRDRETVIMNAIFTHHPLLQTETINPSVKLFSKHPKITIEGGDFLVARDDIFLIGTGNRTSTTGIDFIIEGLKQSKKEAHHIIVQELPESPESFIHLDMVFTLLDKEFCMVYSPVIFGLGRYRTIHIEIENREVVKIEEVANIPVILKKLGMDLKPIYCGGNNNSWIQEREQWHSGANFFSFAPGKVIGYERNVHTLESLNQNGFEIIRADEFIENKKSPHDYQKCVITIRGSELSRGGGGARCMTMPVNRAEVNW
jgi:arginine deiminase